jgi:hypothetical protein
MYSSITEAAGEAMNGIACGICKNERKARR